MPYSGLVVEADSDRVLYERNADELRHPASVTKMMTLYLVFEALANGDLYEDTMFRTSRYAVMRPPSRLGLRAGDALSVEDAILALVTRSANDAASVIAEGMAGSESAFAAMMTAKARELGMSRTVFRNASGLPDPNQVTTAWDMYRLGRALYKNFPQYYGVFSTPKFYYLGHGFENHNHLMERYPGMDGIKTGFINSSGFNLVASAVRGGRRLIGVVFGGPSAVRRDNHMAEILDDGFAQLLEGAPPGVITAEFDRPAAPPSLLARPRLDDTPEFVGEEPEPTARGPRLASYAEPEAAPRHHHKAAVPRRAEPAPHLHAVATPQPHHREAGKSAASARRAATTKSAPPAHAAAPAKKSKTSHQADKSPPEKPEKKKQASAAKSNAATACPKGKTGKPAKCGARA